MFQKQALTFEVQVDQLIARGLIIEDRDAAIHFLQHISYYRLAGYWWSMQAD